jgi:UDP:flavonoid glycosyltransferase YjiC (YdhE family)
MNENAARIDWAGVGVRLPRRYTSARSLRLAVGRALGEPARRRRARELEAWARVVDPPAVAARLVEDLARRGG